MAEHEQGAERWRWEKSEGVWLVYNDKSEGFIANSERSAILACHYINALEADLAALRQQLADAEAGLRIANKFVGHMLASHDGDSCPDCAEFVTEFVDNDTTLASPSRDTGSEEIQ